MKRGRLPLTALHSFEVAGRLLSFTQAAEELFVSQAAISRQVRELESWLGCALFGRRHRRVVLTDGGHRLLACLTSRFDDIDRELSALRAAPVQTTLIVSVEPGFATCWLVPRLDRFRREWPDIDVAVEADARLVEFRSHGAELAIRYGPEGVTWPRTRAERLAGVVVAPVLASSLTSAEAPLATPADLLRHTLLHEESRSGWVSWFRAAGLAHVTPERGPIFADAGLAMQAALRGHGVALGDLLLAQDDLDAGRLTMPFDVKVNWGAYFLVTPQGRRLSEPARAFCSWMRAQLAAPPAFQRLAIPPSTGRSTPVK